MCICLNVSDMKNAVIGNNKQKTNLIVLGAVPRSVPTHILSFPLFPTFCDYSKWYQSPLTVCLFTGYRLLYLLQQSSSSLELRRECSVVLGSLAMGTENNIKSLVDCHIIPALLQGCSAHTCLEIPTGEVSNVRAIEGLCFVLTGLLCPDLIYIEACLRCLRTVFISPVTPGQLLYTVGCFVHVMTAIFKNTRSVLDITCLISKCSLCSEYKFISLSIYI